MGRLTEKDYRGVPGQVPPQDAVVAACQSLRALDRTVDKIVGSDNLARGDNLVLLLRAWESLCLFATQHPEAFLSAVDVTDIFRTLVRYR